jgi:hypothetical protein
LGATHSLAKRLSFRLVDFRPFIRRSNVGIARDAAGKQKSAAFQFSVKNACRTTSQSVQAPTVFVLNSGTARRIVPIRIASLSKTVN